MKLVYAPQPTPIFIETLAKRRIIAVSCGHNHTLAVDSDGIAFSWGFGGYGRLGHKVQQDEHKPRPIESFLGRVRVEKDGLVVSVNTTRHIFIPHMLQTAKVTLYPLHRANG